MKLSELLASAEVRSTIGPLDRPVRGLSHDSREVGPDDVFVAIAGGRADARRFAAALPCAAVVCEGPVQTLPGVTQIDVPDARLALAALAAALYGHPARALPVVGLTGTNGKTTTSFLVEAIAAAAGLPSLLIGTTGHRLAGKALPAAHTTPEAPTLQRLLAEARAAGCGLAVMEVSSIGLAQRRVDHLPFAAAGFTSFSQDHLDFHGTMQAYLAAKWRLFTELLVEDGVAVLNFDDPAVRAHPPLRQRVWGYGRAADATLRIEDDAVIDLSGCRATVQTPVGPLALRTPLLGAHNLENATCALGLGLALGLDPAVCLAGIAAAGAVPGRLERVPSGEGDPVVLVDYAHSPDALERSLETVRALGPTAVHVVFGCGGDRDRGKRPLMGAIAARLADRVTLTSDNPRSEDPEVILDEIAAGLPAGAAALREADRAAAITAAVRGARAGEVVLIAGKGHETTQTIGDRTLPFDDRAVAAAALRSSSPSAPGDR
jgi:UDP-N-acetylmuramoyl-L-alanyl-D-glutamate--2,6-diaminopimelate ligase